MIAELIPEAYDFFGKPTSAPISRRQKRVFEPSFPLGRFLTQPLAVRCVDIPGLCRFLRGCKYVSDQEQFGRKDYWQPPEDFEKTRQGDCDDFALWTWRQLIDMGYRTRYVVGRAGRYGEGHAWVTIEKGGRHFLVEPLACLCGERLPRLSAIRYEPYGSVEWDGEGLRYYFHERRSYNPPLRCVLPLLAEWVFFWCAFWMRHPWLLFTFPIRQMRRLAASVGGVGKDRSRTKRSTGHAKKRRAS